MKYEFPLLEQQQITPNLNYVIAIPSYKREKLLLRKTLKTLHDGQIKQSKIVIFVANYEEYKTYSKYLSSKSKLLNYNPNKYEIVIGKKGIREQRIFINEYFYNFNIPNIIFMDDDVGGIDQMTKGGKFIKITDIDNFINKGFTMAYSKNVYLWGIYSMRNAKFMRQRTEIQEGLSFIVGSFYGQRTRLNNNIIVQSELKVKIDVCNSIKHYIEDGSVLRFNYVTIRTAYGNPKGGIAADIQKENIQKLHIEGAKYLAKHYPKLGYTRKNKTYGLNFILKYIP